MKIAYFIGSLNRGGAETLMLDVFRNADKAPFEMIGIHRKGGAYMDDFYAAGPKMIQCAPNRFGYLRYLLQLRKILKSENITIVHAQHWLDVIYAYLATIGLQIRVALTLHGYFPMKGLVGWLCGLSIRIADKICFVSQYEQDWYRQYCKIADVKCCVIYNGVDFSKIDSAEPSWEFVHQSQRIRLAMVGNFVSVRSQNIIAKSILLLRQRGICNFDLYFIGRRVDAQYKCYDDCYDFCKEYHLNNVHFLGGRGDVPALLKAMDGFVYSSVHDTFGIAVVEAMAVGLPIVVNDYAVMKEVCGENENNAVIYFKSKDVEDCAAAIEKLLAELTSPSDQFINQCANNAQGVRNRYSIEAYITRLYHIYCE